MEFLSSLDLSTVKDGIHVVSTALEIPVIIVLLVALVIVVFQLGSVIVEFFAERAGKKLNVTRALEEVSGQDRETKLEILQGKPFLKRQKRIFTRLLESTAVTKEDQKLFAVQLLSEEESRLEKKLAVTDIIARIGPMFGLMATLIPLGPGLIALGQGDTKGLSDSLLTAFDATVAGLAAAGVAFIISKVRKRWYQSDMMTLETILEGVID
ncbi:MAG: MotA/TolQ/ExbB proton channel family protein [Clostridiales Family XIII bacterium]|nr:MotA/TolQ/ExbB proton channel family protein [Clostridiales Family XIII bacterium]